MATYNVVYLIWDYKLAKVYKMIYHIVFIFGGLLEMRSGSGWQQFTPSIIMVKKSVAIPHPYDVLLHAMEYVDEYLGEVDIS